MSDTGLGRAAFHCYPVLNVVIGCIPFLLKGEKMVVEGGTKKTLRFGASELEPTSDIFAVSSKSSHLSLIVSKRQVCGVY